jgi:Putative auto-transporter adhesin, head GIN domain
MEGSAMTKLRLMACVAFAAMLAACAFDSIEGSGKIVTDTRAVSGVSAVSVSGSGRLIVEQTGTESLTVTTDDNLLPYIKTEVRSGRLELGVQDNSMTNLRPSKDIVFHLTVKQMNDIGVSGSGEADVKGLVQDSLKVGISGSGSVTAHGNADNLEVGVSGSGQYRGADLAAKRATASVSGSGDVVLAVSDSLEANVSGSGSVEYVGNPRVTEHVSGSGSVRKR